jgi:ZIP family zinc transporter
VLLLGAVAGLTIFCGLPVGRWRGLSGEARAFLNATAIGVLAFLLYDVLANGVEPLNRALHAAVDANGSWWHFAGLSLVFAAGLAVGSVSLVYYERWMTGRTGVTTEPVGPVPRRFGPGAASIVELQERTISRLSPAQRLSLFIALGIGLHNFSEGLAIGQSAAKGEVSLALLLIIGFGLHNATEGFGIVAPLTGEPQRASWGLLVVLGLIGGGPTFLGTVVGHAWVNDAVFLGFLTLAAGSILYVIVQLLQMSAKLGHKELLMWGILLGLLAGFATDFVLTAAGV